LIGDEFLEAFDAALGKAEGCVIVGVVDPEAAVCTARGC
jgi:hypothetical protein